MPTEHRLRELISHRVKILGSIGVYQRRIDRLKYEQLQHINRLKTVQAHIQTEKKRLRILWWWPWGD